MEFATSADPPSKRRLGLLETMLTGGVEGGGEGGGSRGGGGLKYWG